MRGLFASLRMTARTNNDNHNNKDNYNDNDNDNDTTTTTADPYLRDDNKRTGNDDNKNNSNGDCNEVRKLRKVRGDSWT
jgi:hypothetical protein